MKYMIQVVESPTTYLFIELGDGLNDVMRRVEASGHLFLDIHFAIHYGDGNFLLLLCTAVWV